MSEIGYPFRLDGRGRTAETIGDDHIRNLIEQFLFTTPGERVNRPDFGSGLLQLVFAPGGAELEATTQFLVQGGLQQWLGDRIAVESVDVTGTDATITIAVQYIVRRTQQRQVAVFTRAV
jgi:uncharacterized protein